MKVEKAMKKLELMKMSKKPKREKKYTRIQKIQIKCEKKNFNQVFLNKEILNMD